jgi:hypothetical protein
VIIWRELEEVAELHSSSVAAVDYEVSELADFIEEHQSARPLRRRIASAIVGLGIRLDPKAADDLPAAVAG